MIDFALDRIIDSPPQALRGKKIGVVCHAASINHEYKHIIDLLFQHNEYVLAAIFGPQHGVHGETQDNMVEWEGAIHPKLSIPVYSLYGTVRKPTKMMLQGLDALIFDIQDVGARPYTYIWTLKLCMEACAQQGIPLWVLDRPNPIGMIPCDGPMLNERFFSFVGGANIPLCHRLTMGEMATIIKQTYVTDCELNVVWMDGWWRNSLWSQTGLPWVMPSPNMPTLDTALVYPGQVLLEATNLSEARGTTRPFELCGAPYIPIESVLESLKDANLSGCMFRNHGFIPTFHKWHGCFCNGFQIHVTDPSLFHPVETTAAILNAVISTAPDEFEWKQPPYEYEHEKMPIDILSGDTSFRTSIENGVPSQELRKNWLSQYGEYNELFKSVAHYPEERG
ncbi:DUF1343 domain-containing protein [Chitinispirillales bacterium ANBcel5]|uniref:exo-beta-N-acetylmuramidase NamZ family protein n=1 Tax=Cellulosispirillum alkaliphilum TaxID=3039283 RepID=UPI002A537E94|nr:DUF1343 domain-containing protein [Chitinispirillales bacterium ANBcel5]